MKDDKHERMKSWNKIVNTNKLQTDYENESDTDKGSSDNDNKIYNVKGNDSNTLGIKWSSI